MMTLDPQSAIVPILRGDAKLPLNVLLGTGFFVGSSESRYLVTAKHVFDRNPLSENEHYAFLFHINGQFKIHRIGKVKVSKEFDICACPVGAVENSEALRFIRNQPSLNDDVFTYEYSSTRFEAKDAGGLHVTFEPLVHKGNVMRFYTSTFPEEVPTPSLQVSFPALQGASGAPIIATNKKKFHVVGVICSNIERELLPAQIVRIEEPGNYVEEIKYFLPHGKALDSKVVVPFLEEIGVVDLYDKDDA